MVDWDLTKERLRAYRRNLANTWSLFKESRIGVVGIGIMIVFVILAALAPYLGLRDPIYWRAPSEDVIALDTYWQADTSSFLFGAGSPIHSQVAMRVIPRATDPRADRLYAASGNKLLALNPAAGGSKGWTAPDQTASFTTAAPITAGPVAVNFGSKTNPSYLDFVVYIGTSDGTFYALNDSAVEFDGDTALPGGSNVMSRSLTGSVTSIAVWSEPTDDPPFPATPARNPGESVFVGTSDGYLYAFAASDLSLLWNRSFVAGVTVRMAAAPMNPPTNPSYSPALTEDGQRLFVNAGDWQSFYALNGTLAWTGFPVSTPWTSAPVVSLPSILADGSFGELVYAASDDGWLFARKVATGGSYVPWETSPTARLHPTLAVRTIPVMETVSQQDRGPLSSPFIDSTTVYVTSRTGILYSIARDAVGTLSAGTVKWRFVDKVLQERGFQFTAPPVLAIAQRIIFGVGVDSKGTPDPSDDQGILYSLSEVGDLLWRKDFDGPLDASPSIWTTQVGPPPHAIHGRHPRPPAPAAPHHPRRRPRLEHLEHHPRDRPSVMARHGAGHSVRSPQPQGAPVHSVGASDRSEQRADHVPTLDAERHAARLPLHDVCGKRRDPPRGGPQLHRPWGSEHPELGPDAVDGATGGPAPSVLVAPPARPGDHGLVARLFPDRPCVRTDYQPPAAHEVKIRWRCLRFGIYEPTTAFARARSRPSTASISLRIAARRSAWSANQGAARRHWPLAFCRSSPRTRASSLARSGSVASSSSEHL